MSYKKGAIQKAVYYSGFASFVASIACLVYLYSILDELGWEHVISASLAASSVFFASMGIVLIVIGKTNLPSFKIEKTD